MRIRCCLNFNIKYSMLFKIHMSLIFFHNKCTNEKELKVVDGQRIMSLLFSCSVLL